MLEKFPVQCEHCGKTMTATSASCGRTIDCPFCKQSLKIPDQVPGKGGPQATEGKSAEAKSADSGARPQSRRPAKTATRDHSRPDRPAKPESAEPRLSSTWTSDDEVGLKPEVDQPVNKPSGPAAPIIHEPDSVKPVILEPARPDANERKPTRYEPRSYWNQPAQEPPEESDDDVPKRKKKKSSDEEVNVLGLYYSHYIDPQKPPLDTAALMTKTIKVGVIVILVFVLAAILIQWISGLFRVFNAA